MKLEKFEKLSDEEKRAWLGDKTPVICMRGDTTYVMRYDTHRQPTEKEISNRARFAERMFESVEE